MCCALQLGFVTDLGVERNHTYASSASAEGTQPRPRLVRVGKEVASLNVDLPLNPSSSVFVRVDEQNMTLWQAVIIGKHLQRYCTSVAGGFLILCPLAMSPESFNNPLACFAKLP